MKKNRRRYLPTRWILLLVIIIFCMGIGYAVLEADLEISGTSDIDSASWDVYFSNIVVSDDSVTAPTPVITNKTQLYFETSLKNPGDFFEFTVDVVNGGTMDAVLENLVISPQLTPEQQNYFKYTVLYYDLLPIEEGDALVAGTTEKLLIRFEYLFQQDMDLYPTDDVNFEFGVSLDYIQGKGNKKVYNISDTPFLLGAQLPSGVQTFDSWEEALDFNLDYNFFTKHKIVNNSVSSSSLGFVLNSTPYYIRTDSSNSYFDISRRVLNKAFGSEKCHDYNSYSSCFDNNIGLYAFIYSHGKVEVSNSMQYNCSGSADGDYYCGSELPG